MAEPVTEQSYIELVNKTNKDDPDQSDVLALREALRNNPELFKIAGSLAQQCVYALLNNSKLTPATYEIVMVDISNIKNDLAFSGAPPLEKLLIDQIVLCYLRLHLWEHAYHEKTGQEGMTFKQAQDWENLISSAQRRYLRAIDALSRIRKLGVNIQVNLASEGGQQVNVLSQNAFNKKEINKC